MAALCSEGRHVRRRSGRAGGCEEKAKRSHEPSVVEVVGVTLQDVPVFREWVGTLDGFVNAQVRAQVTGYLLRQAYQEGSILRKGDLLFQIDPRLFQAVVENAESPIWL